MSYLRTANTLVGVGGGLCILGAMVNIAVGVLRYSGVSQPLVALWLLLITGHWIPFYGPLPFYPFGFGIVRVVVPIVFGMVGGWFAIAAIGRRPKLVSQPKATGIALLIYGVIAGVGCWGIGGVLIVVAGILSLLNWSDLQRTPRAAQVRVTQLMAPAKVVQPPSGIARVCTSCGASVDAGDQYCFRCGAAIQ